MHTPNPPVDPSGGAPNLLSIGCSYRNTPVEMGEPPRLQRRPSPAGRRCADDATRLRGRHPQHVQPRRTVSRSGTRQAWPGRQSGDAGSGRRVLRGVSRSALRGRAAASVHPSAGRRGAAPLPRGRQPDSHIVGEGQIAGQVKKPRMNWPRNTPKLPAHCCTRCSAMLASCPSCPHRDGHLARSPCRASLPISCGRCSTTSRTRPCW